MHSDSIDNQIQVLIEAEHPQIAAVILFSLPPAEAGKILNDLPYNLALELSERIYHITVIDEDVKEILNKRLSFFNIELTDWETTGDIILLNTIEHCIYLRKREIILGLEDFFSIKLEYTGYKIIEDIALAESDLLVRLLEIVDLNDLTLILRIAPLELKDRFFSLLPENISSEIQSNLDWSGGVRMDDIADASERVLYIINHIDKY